MELFRPRRPNRDVVTGLTPTLGQHPSDAAAIALSLNEPAAFGAVFERHFSLVHRFLCARVGVDPAADLASETFAIAFRRRADYDLERPDARPWLIGIAVNLARQARRSEGRLNRALARLAGERTLQQESPEARLEPHGNITTLREVLADLSPDDRDLLLLFACLEFSYEQIAETMSLPIGTVRSRINRLRHKLRGRLTEAAGEPEGV
jgi:RNA polymerase sigma factor (sigma-70 family)